MMCIAGTSFDDGPLMMRVDFGRAVHMDALDIRVGTPLWMDNGDLLLGERVRLRMSGAQHWAPPEMTMQAPREAVLDTLRAVADSLAPVAPSDGLAPLVRYVEALSNGDTVRVDHETPLVCAAFPAVLQIVTGLWTRDAVAIEGGVGRLVGLGPGLTPSGDDFLGGMMLGLIGVFGLPADGLDEVPHGASGHDRLVALAESIRRHAIDGTTAISRAMLEHACAGAGSASVHTLVQRLLQADIDASISAALAVTRIGHTSGWDCLFGTFLGMHLALLVGEPRALCPARPRTRDGGRKDT